MISLDQVTAAGSTFEHSRRTVTGVTVDLGPGCWALLGGENDGGGVLLEALAGVLRLRHGQIRYFGSSDTAAQASRRIAYVGREGLLPDTLTVAEVMVLGARLRREPPQSPEERLRPWGLDRLAARAVRTLTRQERRSVAFAEALTSEARLILLHEPLCEVDDRLVAALPDALRRRAAAGDCIVFATGSMRDAMDLAHEAFVLRAGQMVARLDLQNPVGFGPMQPPVMQIRTRHARLLLAELALEPEVVAIDASAPDAPGVRPDEDNPSRHLQVRGRTLAGLAEAVARAILRTDVGVDAISTAPPTRVEVQEFARTLAPRNA